MSDHRSKTPCRVTLEDLLHLKRAERPPQEFWAGFEQELRQKQLAALVERRSWWHGFAAAFSRFHWLRLPVGAAAVLAVTLISIRHYSFLSRYRDEPLGVAVGEKQVLDSRTSAMAGEPRRAEDVRAAPISSAATSPEKITPNSTQTGSLASDVSRTTPQQIVELIEHVAEMDNSSGSSGSESLAGSFAMQLGSPIRVDSMLVEAAVHPVGFEDRSVAPLHPRRTAETLPTAAAVTEQRRSRLLVALGSAGTYTPEPSAPEHARRSVIRYLAEDGWDRSMSRLQAEADHLSIRF